MNSKLCLINELLEYNIVTPVPGTNQRRPGNGGETPAPHHGGLIGPS